jgi:oxygen-dependent protoporphyrinogen oxidase
MGDTDMSEYTGTVVIGAGLAGLTAAYELQKKGLDVRVLEAESKVGGVIRSVREAGFELDLGPNSLVLNPGLEAWIEELDLGPKVLPAAPLSKNRYLVKHKTLHALSPHPLKLLRSQYLSWPAKGRILTERFRTQGRGEDESVAAFFSRRFGKEISEGVADPIFIGMLSLDQVLPMLARWEQDYGSVTKGALSQKSALKGRSIISFEGGLESLTRALAAPLEGKIHKGSRVAAITAGADRYSIRYVREGREQVLEAGNLIYTAPLYSLGKLSWREGETSGTGAGGAAYAGDFEALRRAAAQVIFAPVRTVHVAVGAEDAGEIPEGFGFLVPSREHLSLLGCIFSSAIFPSKAPPGQVLLTVMLGGVHRGTELLRSGAALQAAALDDLRTILRIRGEVRVLQETTWARAIPQKNLGYEQVLEAIQAFERAHPRCRFAGNGVSGVSVGDTMEFAAKVVHSLI